MARLRTILLVDDDADARVAVATLLESEGYTVREARHGLEALQILRGEPRPDVILLDMMMPVMDGAQFRKAQLADDRLAPIPVIIFTAAGHMLLREEDAEVVRKPPDIDRLLSTLSKCFPPETPPS